MSIFKREEISNFVFSYAQQTFVDAQSLKNAPTKVLLLTQDLVLTNMLSARDFHEQLQQQNIELATTQSLNVVQKTEKAPVLVTEDMAAHLPTLTKGGRRVVVLLSDRNVELTPAGVTCSCRPSSEAGWQALLSLCAIKAELANTSQQLRQFEDRVGRSRGSERLAA
jgi:hypothetical protein